MRILTAGQCEVRHLLGHGVHMDAEQHLELKTRALALGHELGQATRHAPDLLEMPRRGRQVHHRRVLRIGHGDDRGHDARSVAESLVDPERPLEDVRRLAEAWADRR